ncbi:hypothetical protein CHS0354_005454 [Potamilus streckersoni]|uniref:Tetratricopeptide repeat protein 12 n=1 Tax=Potamilus streckersoni TaxID=2493646 RepID=A0AAE0SFG6_9BIVA|nr:hypothetical protein CHS0354_005454 [Potamilus streckersoni]
MASKDVAGFDDFLSKVDELESIVKGLQAADDNTLQKAIQRADEMIEKVEKDKGVKKVKTKDSSQTKTGFSKTVINKQAANSASPIPTGADETLGHEAFLAALEKDARERAERRKEQEKESNEIKELGNAEFRQGNYETAVEHYTKALDIFRNSTALWTNRAMAYIRLQKYEEALNDCDWALKVQENCVKAHIHKGKAYMGLKQYDKARKCYKQALEIDPKKELLIKEYMTEVDRSDKADQEEDKANALFVSGDTEVKGLVQTLKKVLKKDQIILYYSGGFRVLTGLLSNNDEKTLFRTHGGLDLISTHPELSRCYSAAPKSVTQEELDMLISAIDMFAEACSNNETNIKHLLEIAGFTDRMLMFLEAKIKGNGRLFKAACVRYLYILSQIEYGRNSILSTFNVPKLVSLLFTVTRTVSQASETGAYVLKNLSIERKFPKELQEHVSEWATTFELLIKDPVVKVSMTWCCIDTVNHLSSDKHIKSKLNARKELWEYISAIIAYHKDKQESTSTVQILQSTLGLLANLTLEESQNMKEFAVQICDNCLKIIKMNRDYNLVNAHCLEVLSHVLTHSIPATDSVCDSGGAQILLDFVKCEHDDMVKAALKALAACTQINEEARVHVVGNKGLGRLLKILKLYKDEAYLGNAALCLSHCTQVKNVCAALAKTDIIKDLLVLARDGKNPVLQKNCAILIAKLAQGDSRHLDRLRELHGIEILHACMNYMK